MLTKLTAKRVSTDPEAVYSCFVVKLGDVRTRLFGNMELGPGIDQARSDIYDMFRGTVTCTKTLDANQTTSQSLH